MPEGLGDQETPVPVGLRVGQGVDLREGHGGVDVVVLVVDAQVELEVGPVAGERVECLLEVVGECHCGKGSRQPRKSCCNRNTFRLMIIAARTEARSVSHRGFTISPITLRRDEMITNGTSANGIPKESTTWLP